MKLKGLVKILLMSVCIIVVVSCSGEEAAQSTQKKLKALAFNSTVKTGPEGNLEVLALDTVKELAVSDQITVDDLGRALLNIADSVVVELIRDGELKIQDVSLDEDTVMLKLILNSGTVLNHLNVENLVDGVLEVDAEFATVTATGTKFVVMREENTPLEWVVALEAGENDLTVTGDGGQEVITTGKAVWIAPDGEPGPVFDANMEQVRSWITEARDGEPSVDLGEVVWAPAVVSMVSEDLPEDVPVGEPFAVHEIVVELDPAGTYEMADCNDDGALDIRAENGRLAFDLRQVIGQKRAIDVHVVNGNALMDTILSGYNPANELVPEAMDAAAGVQNVEETLSLRSEVQPFHFAELVIEDGCFTGLDLVPPTQDPEPIATFTPTATITPTPSPTHTPTATFTPTPTRYVCQPSPPPGWRLYVIQPGDTLFSLAARTNVTVAMIQAVNCLSGDRIDAGQQIWLPYIPPTVTPTPLVCSGLNFTAGVNPYTQEITIQTTGFPANTQFGVWVAQANGSGPIAVGQFNSGSGGMLYQSVPIPSAYVYESNLLVIIESTDPAVPCYSGSLSMVNDSFILSCNMSFEIMEVSPNQAVSIYGTNMPPNQEVEVYMYPWDIYAQHSGSYFVGTLVSSKTGAGFGTYLIPEMFYGDEQIGIQLVSGQGCTADNWFYNEQNTGLYATLTAEAMAGVGGVAATETPTITPTPSVTAVPEVTTESGDGSTAPTVTPVPPEPTNTSTPEPTATAVSK